MDSDPAMLGVRIASRGPRQYPSIFFKSELLTLNKMDLLAYVPFDSAAAEQNARSIHRNINIVRVSCKTREALTESLA
jgi:hydrogenase nickel incorporation protein HypB